jgi:hypothetical protein
MKKRFTEEQIIKLLVEAQAGITAEELGRRQTFSIQSRQGQKLYLNLSSCEHILIAA